ncbi:hypothetical protein O7C57_12400 [Providencia sp. 21OH12SH02B-Prov]|uniref:hypothetical protein n=1 Tax=Providencia sp. 21OH12SH02B-Prov TaxID=3015951 RepID=UPI0022B69BBC|nr:hypothetical protein [Providencia sp. 21OH12SH02B-Prov]WBA55660.1 hypothetical protein O7C57_12400 [Providencia sp. 21OH12SH02B-Prov]
MKKIILLLSLFFVSAVSLADCHLKKAARNKMLDQKIGISGRCDTQKAIKDQATKQIDERLGIHSQDIKQNISDKKNISRLKPLALISIKLPTKQHSLNMSTI